MSKLHLTFPPTKRADECPPEVVEHYWSTSVNGQDGTHGRFNSLAEAFAMAEVGSQIVETIVLRRFKVLGS